MARPSKSYDPNTYGQSFDRIPEGVHKFTIVSGEVTMSKKGDPMWKMNLQPSDTKYQNDYGYNAWLFEEGVVNAIFDAAGADPNTAPDKDFQPWDFNGKEIMAEIVHNEVEKDGKTKIYANIKKLYPQFSNIGKPETEDGHNYDDLPF